MPRANRYIVPGHIYHVTHRCHNRQFFLKFAKDRAMKWIKAIIMVASALTSQGSASWAAEPETRADGHIRVLDDFDGNLDAWQPQKAASGSVQTITDELGSQSALDWSLGDVSGKLVYRHMDDISDFGRYNRMRFRVRAWDAQGRVGVGGAAKLSMRLSGWPRHLANRAPSWGIYDRNPKPSKEWRVINQYLDFPSWYPWEETDNTERGLTLKASAGFAKKATLRIDRIALIDDVVEVHGDWGDLTENKDGSAHWDYEIRLENRTDQPRKVSAKAVSPSLSRFSARLLDQEVTLAPLEKDVLHVRVKMPAQVISQAEPLYHEDLFVKVTPLSQPKTATTVRLPATIPMELGERPTLLHTKETWERKRAEFSRLDPDARQKRLNKANTWLEKEIELPPPYKREREVTLVNGETLELPNHAWDGGKDRWKQHKKLFHAVRTLGEAYQLTKNRSYAEKAAEIVKAYAANLNRYPRRGIAGPRERGWARLAINNLHEGWLIMPMCYGYDMIRNVPNLFSPQERQRIANQLFIPLGRTETPITSWYSNQTSVRYMAAALCGFNAGDPNLVHFSVFGHAGLQRSINISINPDGFLTEMPINYHWANLIEMLKLAVVLKNTGMDINYRRDLLEKACRVPYRRAFPNGHVVGFGPHGYGIGPGFGVKKYATVARLFDDRLFKKLNGDPWDDAARERRRRILSHQESVHFPNTELIVLRQGKGDSQHAINFIWGNKRRAHDAALAFTWYGKGELLAPAVGSLYNVTSPEDAWISPFYCQVNVDDKEQVASTGRLTFHQLGDGPQIASARADKLFPGVRVERTLALHDGLVFLADRFASEATHHFQWTYLTFGELSTNGQFHGKTLNYRNKAMRLSGRTTDQTWHAVWDRDALKLRVSMLGSPKTQVFSGKSYISPGNEDHQTPMALARREGEETVFLSVLEPFNDKPRVKSIEREPTGLPESEAVAMRVTLQSGKSYVFAVSYTDKPIAGKDWHLDQRAGLIPVDR